MDGCDLHHDETQAITRNGRQDDGCQGQTGAVAPRCVREHGSILSLKMAGKRGERGNEWKVRRKKQEGRSKKLEGNNAQKQKQARSAL